MPVESGKTVFSASEERKLVPKVAMIRGSCGQVRKQKCKLSIGARAGGVKGSWGLSAFSMAVLGYASHSLKSMASPEEERCF